MTRIAVILGSTRPGRRGVAVARWVEEVAGRHPAVSAGDATVEVCAVLCDEPGPVLRVGIVHDPPRI